METVTREKLNELLKKVKRFKPPVGLEEIDFGPLKFLAWWDQTANAYYLVHEMDGDEGKELVGLKFDVLKLSTQGPFARAFCELCHKHRKRDEVLLVSTRMKKKIKGVDYRAKGIYVCSDPMQCNRDMKNTIDLDYFVQAVLKS